jgi:hypothetical protein
VSLTSLNNTGVQQNFATALLAMKKLSMGWKRKCFSHLTTFPSNKSKGESFVTFPFLGTKTFFRFADRSARFISAYRQGLSSAQALWANQKFHGHRVLPPDMVTFVKETVPQ